MKVRLEANNRTQRIPVLTDMPHAGDRSEPPPPHLLPSIMQSITEAVQEMPPDADMALVGKATKDGGWNAGVLVRTHSGWNVHAWVADKDWTPGHFDYGVEVLKTWKF